MASEHSCFCVNNREKSEKCPFDYNGGSGKIHISAKNDQNSLIFTGDMYWVNIYSPQNFDPKQSKFKVVVSSNVLKLQCPLM